MWPYQSIRGVATWATWSHAPNPPNSKIYYAGKPKMYKNQWNFHEYFSNFWRIIVIFVHHFLDEVSLIIPKMLKRLPINFNSTSNSGKTSIYMVTNSYPECIKTHHCDIKIPKIFWGLPTPPPWHLDSRAFLTRSVPQPRTEILATPMQSMTFASAL